MFVLLVVWFESWDHVFRSKLGRGVGGDVGGHRQGRCRAGLWCVSPYNLSCVCSQFCSS